MNSFIDASAEVGSDEEEEFDSETGETLRKSNGGHAIVDSSEEDDDDDEEEARAVGTPTLQLISTLIND
jgi:transcription elongation factor SPT6